MAFIAPLVAAAAPFLLQSAIAVAASIGCHVHSTTLEPRR